MTTSIKQGKRGELEVLELSTEQGAQMTIALQGAQVLSWIPACGGERLYLSDCANYSPGLPIRGGIPIAFPQFSNFGLLPKHGFARTQPWEVTDARIEEGYAIATLRLLHSPQTAALWPHSFSLELTACISDNRLDVELELENKSHHGFDFTCALHTYLRVDEVENAQLHGLRGHRYFDALRDLEQHDSGVHLTVDQAIDRIYYAVTNPLMLNSGLGSLGIYSDMPDAVVWNPWEEKCASLPDMEKQDFRRMLCIEAAAVREPVHLNVGQIWSGRQSLVAL